MLKWLAEWSVRNSLLVNLLTAFLILSGVLALFNIRREAFPNINLDIVQVSTKYPGSTPGQVEKLITIPLEKELKEVDDIKEMVSVSTEGFSLVFLTIEPDAENKDKVVNDIQRAVDRVEDLPDDLEDKPVVQELSTKNTPLIEVSLYGKLTPEELRTQARRLEDALLGDPHIASVVRRGYREPEFSVEVNPQKMAEYHVSLNEVWAALKNTNINIPGGSVIEGNEEYILRVAGEFFTAEQIGEVIVRANDRGHHIKVKDIAKVLPRLEEITISNRTDGSDALNLLVIKKQRGDVIELVKDAEAIIANFLKTAPPELKISVVNDISFYVERRLKVLINNGVLGLFLLMIPLVLFLSPRTALSAAIGMPTAIAAAFAMMHFFGITINLMSLFGMIMVLGMLVDEDIVIAENVHRYLEKGMPPKEAAIRGTTQVAKSVVATVLTTITAFIPLLMMSGIMGKFVRQIPLVVIITLSASLLQALVILPSHIADLNKMSEDKAKGMFRGSANHRIMNWLLARYERALRLLISWRYPAAFLFCLGMAGVSLLGYFKVPFILFPNKGIEQFFIRVEGPIGTPIEVTTERMKSVEAILAALPKTEIDHYITQGGITQNDPTDPFTNRSTHIGQVWVFLTPEQDRARNADQIIEELRPKMEKVAGFNRVYFDRVRPGPPVGKPVAVRIRGDDFEQLNKLAEEYVAYLKGLPGVTDIKNDFEYGKDELKAVLDEDLMRQAGLTHQDVAAAIRMAFDGGVATTIKEGDEEIDVVVRFPEGMREQKATLGRLLIQNPGGKLVPLNAIAAFKEEPSLAVIKHDLRKRLVTITADVDQSVTTSRQVNAKLIRHFKDRLEKTPGILVKYGGEEEDTQESLESLFRAFILALFLTFIIIAATFRSLWEPFVIMTTIPMGIIGVIVAFYFEKEPLTFLALLGVVGFAGVVVDSAILMVDFINEERAEGVSFREAIILGAKARLRPIILTTLTTVLGLVPAAFGIGGSDPFIQPMAKAMNWGISAGSLLAIFLIPVFLAILGDAARRLMPKKWGN